MVVIASRFVRISSTLAFMIAASGCSSSASPSAPAPGAGAGAGEGDGGAGTATNNATGTGGSGLTVLFPAMYSAFDGTHTFQLPATVEGVKGITWTAGDPTMVDLAPDPTGSTVMITVKKAGNTTITATAGTLSGSAPLTIYAASPTDWDTGNQRYNNGVVVTHTHPDGGGPPAPPTNEAACTNCHGDAGRADIEHTPTQTAGYSDAELITIFTQGQKPAGVPQRIMPYERWHTIHQWAMDPASQQGVVVYLRALEPKSQGLVEDFGGHGFHGDAGGPPPADAGAH